MAGRPRFICGRIHRQTTNCKTNLFDDLIHNFDGTSYWFSGTQGGASHGSVGDEAMKLNDEGDLYLSGALARIRGRDNVGITSNSLDDLINNFDGTAYWFSGTQGGDSHVGNEVMKVNAGGLYLKGALAKVRGQEKVGITSNTFNDMINNFDGAVYWFKGVQGGDSEGGGTRLMKLDTNGDLEVKGKVKASNSVKEYDSGWFNITPLQTVDVIHDLGVLPKHVTVWCANSGSGDPTSPSIAGPFFVKSSATEDRGAYIAKVTTTRLQVRAGSYLGINEAHNAWLTSGRYRVVVWA